MIKQIFSRFGRKKDGPVSDVLLKDLPTCGSPSASNPDSSVVPLRSAVTPLVPKKKDSAEVFQEAVDKLVSKLEGINDHLASQIRQNERLVEKMDALPAMLMPLPKAVEAQQAAFAQVAEQLRDKIARDEKVADELTGIHEKVAASADADVKLCETFGAISETLTKLDADTTHQTEWIQHMGHTFASSERYMKDILNKQQTRFYWVCGILVSISLLAVVGLIVGIILLRG